MVLQRDAGVLERRDVASASVPGKRYAMVRTPGGWQHADASCDGWIFSGARGECRHTKELNMTTEHADQETMTRALRVFDGMDDRAIVEHLNGKATGSWAYRIQVGGQTVEGISVDGVQEIIRRLAAGGEVIREVSCELTYEDAAEARFVATAGRYIVSADGREVLMDTAIRGKRQAKVMRRRDGREQADEHWFEKGVAKAVRNAAEALIPEVGKQRILEDARNSGRMAQASPAASSEGLAHGDSAEAQEARELWSHIQRDYAPQNVAQLLPAISVPGKLTTNGNIAFTRYTPDELAGAIAAMREFLDDASSST